MTPTTVEAPVARPDYQGAALAAIVVFVAVALGVAWLSWFDFSFFRRPVPPSWGAIDHMKGALAYNVAGWTEAGRYYGSVLRTHADAGMLHLIEWRFLLSFGAGLVAAVAVWMRIASRLILAEVHKEGPQLRIGARAARWFLLREKMRSRVLFKWAEIGITRDRARRSILALGSIGGGKTQLVWSLLIGFFQSGHRVLLVDGPKGDYSTCLPNGLVIVAPWHDGPAWDIASDCCTRAHARELAKSLVPVSEKDPLWGNAAGMVFVSMICKLQVERGTDWDWGDLGELIALPVTELKPIAEKYYPPAVAAIADAESKTTQSIMINLTSFMADVYEMALAWKGAKERFSFARWWAQDVDDLSAARCVVLQGSGEFKTLAGGYISAIVQMLANLSASPSFPESKTRKNLIVIDEFAQLPKMPGFEKFIEIGRSKGCSVIIATQSLFQIKKIWGEDDMKTWIGMIGTKIYARVVGPDDEEIVQRQLKKRIVCEPTVSSSTGPGGTTYTHGWREVLRDVVPSGYLEETLGPQEDGLVLLAQGFGKDPIQVKIGYESPSIKRDAYKPNPRFNAPLGLPAQAAAPEGKTEEVQTVDAKESTTVDAACVATVETQSVAIDPELAGGGEGFADDERDRGSSGGASALLAKMGAEAQPADDATGDDQDDDSRLDSTDTDTGSGDSDDAAVDVDELDQDAAAMMDCTPTIDIDDRDTVDIDTDRTVTIVDMDFGEDDEQAGEDKSELDEQAGEIVESGGLGVVAAMIGIDADILELAHEAAGVAEKATDDGQAGASLAVIIDDDAAEKKRKQAEAARRYRERKKLEKQAQQSEG